jgi:hypothetical protein
MDRGWIDPLSPISFRWLQVSSDANGPKELESGKFFCPPISLRTTFHLLILNWCGPFDSAPETGSTRYSPESRQLHRPVVARQTSAVVSAGAVSDCRQSSREMPDTPGAASIEGGCRGCRYDVLALIGVERDAIRPNLLSSISGHGPHCRCVRHNDSPHHFSIYLLALVAFQTKVWGVASCSRTNPPGGHGAKLIQLPASSFHRISFQLLSRLVVYGLGPSVPPVRSPPGSVIGLRFLRSGSRFIRSIFFLTLRPTSG